MSYGKNIAEMGWITISKKALSNFQKADQRKLAPSLAGAKVSDMSLAEAERVVMSLSEKDRALLAASLLNSLPAVLDDFEFVDIPAGSYLLECGIFWEVAGVSGPNRTEGFARREVTVRDARKFALFSLTIDQLEPLDLALASSRQTAKI